MRSALFLASFGVVLASMSSCSRAENEVPFQGRGSQPAIVGGQVVSESDPIASSTVAIISDGRLCSGVIIAPRIVLSAAHCFQSRRAKAKVIFGKAISQDQTRNKAQINSSAIVQHFDWRPRMKDSPGDLAMILLERPAPSQTVFAVILPLEYRINAGDWFIAAGYGQTRPGQDGSMGVSGPRPSRLKKTALAVEGWENSTEVRSDGRKTSPCFGDSGGPAFIERDGHLYLWGIDVRSGDASPCQDTVTHTALAPYSDWLDHTSRELLARAK